MSRLSTSFVLGYHGCDRSLAERVIAGNVSLAPSDTKFDWVGPGIYFWESDPMRAWEWAQARCDEKAYDKPGVVGAIIDLRHCLDLLNRIDQDLVKDAHASLARFYAKANKKMAENRNSPTGGDTDRRARALDCDVIKHLHTIMDYQPDDSGEPDEIPPLTPFYDTVRAMFTEGEPLYKGAAFYTQSHIQIAVRSPDCIKGVFYPPELHALQNVV